MEHHAFGARSIGNFFGVHPDLIAVMYLGLLKSPYDFAITEGLRTKSRQKKLVSEGKSTTLNSRHIPSRTTNMSHAVDIAAYIDGEIVWEPWEVYVEISDAIKEAAQQLNVNIEWGGDWKSFKDGAHFQLPWGEYP